MKKQALLIGINNYEKNSSINNLRYARQDAEEVCAALQKSYGFTEDEITLMTCEQDGTLSPATPPLILNQLRPEQFPEPVDLFIFGFWGHGIWENNVRYLCPMTTLESDLAHTCLSLGDVTQRISKLPIHNACFILDCCQNIAGRGAQYMSEEEKSYLENMARDIVFKGQNLPTYPEVTFNRNVAILNACRQGEVAYEWDDRKHGIFTAHLLDAMEKRMNSVNDWAAYLANRVRQTAARLGKKTQTPLCSLEGCIELPVSTVPEPDKFTPSPIINDYIPQEETMKQAALKLVELFQDSLRLYENENVHTWFLRQKEEFLSVYIAIDNHSMNGQTAYSRILEIARNSGNWVNSNRSLLRGKRLPYTSYLWYSWKEFANKNRLEDISSALNP